MHNCKWCSKNYTTRGKLKLHVAKHHPDSLQEFIDIVSKCPHCKLHFDSYHKLGAHRIWCGISDQKSITIRRKLSLANVSRKHSTETKEKLSISRSAYLEEVGGGGFTHIKYYDAVNIENNMFKVRGTWELKVANWLNSKNVLWIRKVYVQYKSDGVTRIYTPDFYLPAHDLYLEVKGYLSELDRNKLNKVICQNDIKLCIITEKTIKRLDAVNSIGELIDEVDINSVP